MKKYAIGISIAITVSVFGGCATNPLTTSIGQNSLPVLSGAATTNSSQTIAWLQYAQSVNDAANPTPSKSVIDSAIGALIALSSAAAGWFGKHQASAAPKNPPNSS